jgi:Flp pilus assembly protein protease CpaA
MSDLVSTSAAVAAALAGAGIDLRTGRIPNSLTAATGAAGLTFAVLGWSGQTAGAAVAGATLGFALMLPQYLFGATGAGDVKLVAAVGTLLGPGGVLATVLFGAVAGGALAIVHACRRQRLALTVTRVGRLVTAPGCAKREIDAAAPATRFAYGPAIAGGVILAALYQ